MSGAGKSTIANLVEKKLHALGRHTYTLDGDNVRHGLNKDLGRDVKGLYKKARRGELKNFTGIDSPYERPDAPEMHLETTRISAEEAANAIVKQLLRAGVISADSL